MTQSVDVNALFDRIALLVTGGEPDNGLTIEQRFTAINERLTIIEDHLSITPDDTGGGDTGGGDTGGGDTGGGDTGGGDTGGGDTGGGDTGGTDPWFDLSDAIIIGESTVYNTNNSAQKLFDSPDDPYYKGTDESSTWISYDVASPYVIIDARAPIKVKSVMFYHWGAETSAQYPDMSSIPRDFNVYSGESATGPWLTQGRNSYVVDETSAFHEHECLLDYNSVTTWRYWKIAISGQEDIKCTLSEARFMRDTTA